jgi:hypothetical protein
MSTRRGRLAAAPSGGGLKVGKLDEPVVAVQMGKLTREPCPGGRRDKLTAGVTVPVTDVVVLQDKPSPPAGSQYDAEDRSPRQHLDQRLDRRLEPHADRLGGRRWAGSRSRLPSRYRHR